MTKERYEFEVTTIFNGKERKRFSKRYSYSQKEAEESIRKTSRSEIKKMTLVTKKENKENIPDKTIESPIVKECAICNNPVFKKGWCINHYVKIFNPKD
jgi:hypothetical protein